MLASLAGMGVLWSCSRHEEPSSEARSIRAAATKESADARRCEFPGKVDKDLTLTKACSPYNVPMGIDVVGGATLTIEPGVEMRFRGTDWFEIGAAGKPGRLIAKGTPEEPIVLTLGNRAKNEVWYGLWFHSGTLEGSVLSHAVVRDAGGLMPMQNPKLPLGCVTLTGVKPGALTIGDVRVERCKNGGLRMTDSHVKLGALSFSDMNEGINVDAASLGQVTQPAQFTQVARNVIRGGNVAESATWIAQPAPYVVEGDVSVGGSSEPKLTLGAGLVLQFAKARGLVVGADQPGGILAEGTREQPIQLTASGTSDTWSGLRLMKHTSAGTRLAFVELAKTDGEAAVVVQSEPGRVELRDSRFLANTRDVLVGCGANPLLGKNAYTAPGGVERQKPCK